jgi:hypothetical protein
MNQSNLEKSESSIPINRTESINFEQKRAEIAQSAFSQGVVARHDDMIDSIFILAVSRFDLIAYSLQVPGTGYRLHCTLTKTGCGSRTSRVYLYLILTRYRSSKHSRTMSGSFEDYERVRPTLYQRDDQRDGTVKNVSLFSLVQRVF